MEPVGGGSVINRATLSCFKYDGLKSYFDVKCALGKHVIWQRGFVISTKRVIYQRVQRVLVVELLTFKYVSNYGLMPVEGLSTNLSLWISVFVNLFIEASSTE